MEPYHWIAKLFNSCYVIITAVSSYLTHVVNELKCWLFQPFRPKNRLHFILKVIAIGIATTFAWYFGWKGIELARKGIHATIQSNQLSAKQICASGVCSQLNVISWHELRSKLVESQRRRPVLVQRLQQKCLSVQNRWRSRLDYCVGISSC